MSVNMTTYGRLSFVSPEQKANLDAFLARFEANTPIIGFCQDIHEIFVRVNVNNVYGVNGGFGVVGFISDEITLNVGYYLDGANSTEARIYFPPTRAIETVLDIIEDNLKYLGVKGD